MAGVQAEIKETLNKARECVKQQKDVTMFYTKDAVLLPPGGPPVFGFDAVSKCLMKINEGVSMADVIFEEPVVKVHGDGTTVSGWLLYDLVNKEGKVFFSGKSACVWRKDEATNEWLLEMEMYNEGR